MGTAEEGERRADAVAQAEQRWSTIRWLARPLRCLRGLSMTVWLIAAVALGQIVAINAHDWRRSRYGAFHSGLPWTCAVRDVQYDDFGNAKPGKLENFSPVAAVGDALVWSPILALAVWIAQRCRRRLGQVARSTRWLGVLTCAVLLLVLITGFEVDVTGERYQYPPIESRMEHGFPLTYWAHSVDPSVGRSARPALRNKRDDLFSPMFFWIDLWLTVLVVAAVTTAFELRRRKGRGRQVSLREFMVLVTVAGLAAAWVARIREGRAIVAALDALDESPSPMLELLGPKWLENLWTEDRLMRRGWFRVRAVGESKSFDFPQDPAKQRALQFLLNRYGDQIALRVRANASLAELGRLEHVRHVWMSERPGPSAELVEVINALPELRTIHLFGANIDDDVLFTLARDNLIERVGAGDSRVTEIGLAAMSQLPRLEELSLYNCDIRSLAGLDADTFRSLKLLDLSDVPLRDAEVEQFRRAHANCEVRHTSEREAREQLAESQAELSDDQEDAFVIWGPIGDAALKDLAGNPHLTNLRLSASLITDEGLQSLALLPQLRELAIDDRRIGDAGLRHLTGCRQLVRLALRCPCMTDAGAVSIGEIASLKHLEIDETQITGAGLASLTRLPKLESLRIHERQLADGGQAAICQIHGLRRLSVVADTVVLKDGSWAAQIRQALPKLSIKTGRQHE